VAVVKLEQMAAGLQALQQVQVTWQVTWLVMVMQVTWQICVPDVAGALPACSRCM
jgi:hypothetical protein